MPLSPRDLDDVALQVAAKTGLSIHKVRRIVARLAAERDVGQRPGSSEALRRAIREGRPGSIWYAHRNVGKD